MSLTGAGEVAELAGDIINKIWPDKTEQAKAELSAALVLVQGQLEVNRAEATNPNLFVAGWRPAVGWICAASFGVQFVVGPLVSWGTALAGRAVVLPSLDLSTMLPILLGMLGLGSLRTIEKVKDVAGNH